jgi:hypothetical protein
LYAQKHTDRSRHYLERFGHKKCTVHGVAAAPGPWKVQCEFVDKTDVFEDGGSSDERDPEITETKFRDLVGEAEDAAVGILASALAVAAAEPIFNGQQDSDSQVFKRKRAFAMSSGIVQASRAALAMLLAMLPAGARGQGACREVALQGSVPDVAAERGDWRRLFWLFVVVAVVFWAVGAAMVAACWWACRATPRRPTTATKRTQSQVTYTRKNATPRFEPLKDPYNGCWSD